MVKRRRWWSTRPRSIVVVILMCSKNNSDHNAAQYSIEEVAWILLLPFLPFAAPLLNVRDRSVNTEGHTEVTVICGNNEGARSEVVAYIHPHNSS